MAGAGEGEEDDAGGKAEQTDDNQRNAERRVVGTRAANEEASQASYGCTE
jgi:hypothetical protein